MRTEAYNIHPDERAGTIDAINKIINRKIITITIRYNIITITTPWHMHTLHTLEYILYYIRLTAVIKEGWQKLYRYTRWVVPYILFIIKIYNLYTMGTGQYIKTLNKFKIWSLSWFENSKHTRVTMLGESLCILQCKISYTRVVKRRSHYTTYYYIFLWFSINALLPILDYIILFLYKYSILLFIIQTRIDSIGCCRNHQRSRETIWSGWI